MDEVEIPIQPGVHREESGPVPAEPLPRHGVESQTYGDRPDLLNYPTATSSTPPTTTVNQDRQTVQWLILRDHGRQREVRDQDLTAPATLQDDQEEAGIL